MEDLLRQHEILKKVISARYELAKSKLLKINEHTVSQSFDLIDKYFDVNDKLREIGCEQPYGIIWLKNHILMGYIMNKEVTADDVYERGILESNLSIEEINKFIESEFSENNDKNNENDVENKNENNEKFKENNLNNNSNDIEVSNESPIENNDETDDGNISPSSTSKLLVSGECDFNVAAANIDDQQNIISNNNEINYNDGSDNIETRMQLVLDSNQQPNNDNLMNIEPTNDSNLSNDNDENLLNIEHPNALNLNNDNASKLNESIEICDQNNDEINIEINDKISTCENMVNGNDEIEQQQNPTPLLNSENNNKSKIENNGQMSNINNKKSNRNIVKRRTKINFNHKIIVKFSKINNKRIKIRQISKKKNYDKKKQINIENLEKKTIKLSKYENDKTKAIKCRNIGKRRHKNRKILKNRLIIDHQQEMKKNYWHFGMQKKNLRGLSKYCFDQHDKKFEYCKIIDNHQQQNKIFMLITYDKRRKKQRDQVKVEHGQTYGSKKQTWGEAPKIIELVLTKNWLKNSLLIPHYWKTRKKKSFGTGYNQEKRWGHVTSIRDICQDHMENLTTLVKYCK